MVTLQSVACTHPGLKRDLNEDRVWAQIYAASDGEPLGLFVVCDGIGGHLGGDTASSLAVETIKQDLQNLFSPKNPRATVLLSELEKNEVAQGQEQTRQSKTSKIEETIVNAIQKANRVIYQYSQQKPQQAEDAGTTITMAIVSGQWAIIANVGDSRTYLLRDQQLKRITKDHSLVASLVERGQIQPEDVFSHPQRNIIYRSLGNRQKLEVDTFKQVVNSGDILLLCSDGLWEMVQDESLIVKIIQEASSLDQACQELVDAANNAGGEDNIGIVIAKIV